MTILLGLGLTLTTAQAMNIADADPETLLKRLKIAGELPPMDCGAGDEDRVRCTARFGEIRVTARALRIGDDDYVDVIESTAPETEDDFQWRNVIGAYAASLDGIGQANMVPVIRSIDEKMDHAVPGVFDVGAITFDYSYDDDAHRLVIYRTGDPQIRSWIAEHLDGE